MEMDLRTYTQYLVRQFDEYYVCCYTKHFYKLQSNLERFVSLFDKVWDYSLNSPEHLEMWRFITDHLIRWLTITSVRCDLHRTKTTIDALRCVTRMNCSKKQFDGWVIIYKIARYYSKSPELQTKILSLFYNICLDENNKQTFITSGGLYALVHVIKNQMDNKPALYELLDLVVNLSHGRSAHYRSYSLHKSNIIPYILLVMHRYPLDAILQDKACTVLNGLAWNEPMERQIVKLGGQKLVCLALSTHGIKSALVAIQSLTKLSESHCIFYEDRWYGIRFVHEMFQRYATDLKMLTELVKLVNHLATYHPSVMTTYDHHRMPSMYAQRMVMDDNTYHDEFIPVDIKYIEEESEKPIVTTFETPFDEMDHTFGKEDETTEPYIPNRPSSIFIFGGLRAPTERPTLRRSSSVDLDNDEFSSGSDEEKNTRNVKNIENIENVLENTTSLIDVITRLIGIVDDEIIFLAIYEMVKTPCIAYDLVCRGLIRHLIHYSFVNDDLSVLNQLVTSISNSSITSITSITSIITKSYIPYEIVKESKCDGYEYTLQEFFGCEAGTVINESLHYSNRIIQFLILCGVILSVEYRSHLSSQQLLLYQRVQHHFANVMKNTLDEVTSIPTDINQLISQFLFS